MRTFHLAAIDRETFDSAASKKAWEKRKAGPVSKSPTPLTSAKSTPTHSKPGLSGADAAKYGPAGNAHYSQVAGTQLDELKPEGGLE